MTAQAHDPATPVGLAAAEAEAVSAVGRLRWSMDSGILSDAQGQAVPYAGDETATDRAWSARVDAAVHGMDELDMAGVDVWAAEHAASQTPHLVEADLVAAWETWVRVEFTTPEPELSSSDDDAQAAEDAAEAAEAEGWVL